MTTLDTVLASLAGPPLRWGGLLKRLHRQARTRPRVLDALPEQARQAGLAVVTEELQAAADVFRSDQGLSTAADTHVWLAAQGLSVADLEASLQASLQAARLEQHLTAGQVDEPVAAHRAEREQVQHAQLLVQRDEPARQVGEGRDLEEVDQHRLLRQDRDGALADELDTAARQRIQDELFESWPGR
jgi:hypothetical protein